MRLLCTLNSEPLDDYQNSLISDAVERLMQRSDRSYPISKLRPLIQSRMILKPNVMDLKPVLSRGRRGKSLAGCSTIGKTRLMSITRMFSVLMERSSPDNKVLASAASFYLIYRVTMLADGRRLLIYMDEFWQWINNEAFRDFVYNKLKTGRKLDMVLVVATQSPDELIKSPIAAAVREQCATHIYLANPKAKRSEYVDGL